MSIGASWSWQRASTRASCAAIGEVGAQHLGVRAVRGLELLGERLEASLVARDEHEVVAALGEVAGELLADPDGRSGDERDRSVHEARMLTPASGSSATSLPFTTMRCAALCLGWHAISVTVGVVVGSTIESLVGRHDGRAGHRVDEPAVRHVEDDPVAGRELVEVEERMGVRHAVPGEHGVAALSRHRAEPGQWPGPVVEHRQPDAFEDRVHETDLRDLDRPDLHDRHVGVRIGRRRLRMRQLRAVVVVGFASIVVVRGAVVVVSDRSGGRTGSPSSARRA